MAASSDATVVAVRALFFAQLRDRFGADELPVSLSAGATGADLMRWLAQRSPTMSGLLAVSRLAVNGEYVSLDHVLRDGDEAVVVPPVSGG